LKFIITTLSSKNDDEKELKQLFHDAWRGWLLHGTSWLIMLIHKDHIRQY
jgi:hypothetical protein